MSDYPMLISNKLHSFRNFLTAKILHSLGICEVIRQKRIPRFHYGRVGGK